MIRAGKAVCGLFFRGIKKPEPYWLAARHGARSSGPKNAACGASRTRRADAFGMHHRSTAKLRQKTRPLRFAFSSKMLTVIQLGLSAVDPFGLVGRVLSEDDL